MQGQGSACGMCSSVYVDDVYSRNFNTAVRPERSCTERSCTALRSTSIFVESCLTVLSSALLTSNDTLVPGIRIPGGYSRQTSSRRRRTGSSASLSREFWSAAPAIQSTAGYKVSNPYLFSRREVVILIPTSAILVKPSVIQKKNSSALASSFRKARNMLRCFLTTFRQQVRYFPKPGKSSKSARARFYKAPDPAEKGLYYHARAGAAHLMGHKSTTRKQRLRTPALLSKADRPRVVRLLKN